MGGASARPLPHRRRTDVNPRTLPREHPSTGVTTHEVMADIIDFYWQ